MNGTVGPSWHPQVTNSSFTPISFFSSNQRAHLKHKLSLTGLPRLCLTPWPGQQPLSSLSLAALSCHMWLFAPSSFPPSACPDTSTGSTAPAKSPASFRPQLNCHLFQEVAQASSLGPLSSRAASTAHLRMDSGPLGPNQWGSAPSLGSGLQERNCLTQTRTDTLTCS